MMKKKTCEAAKRQNDFATFSPRLIFCPSPPLCPALPLRLTNLSLVSCSSQHENQILKAFKSPGVHSALPPTPRCTLFFSLPVWFVGPPLSPAGGTHLCPYFVRLIMGLCEKSCTLASYIPENGVPTFLKPFQRNDDGKVLFFSGTISWVFVII